MSDHHRSTRERWIIEGKLLLETPAHFGNGDADALTDMPLIFDEISNEPLLPGTSIAGALRNYLREFQNNYGGKFPDKEGKNFKLDHEAEVALLATKLFGGYRGDEEGEQSPLIIHDALGKSAGFELRDGVKIDAKTRTAEDQKKFDIQLLSAGTTFDLRFELLLTKSEDDEKLKQALATALMGLANGEITLGARKSRGFGQCSVKEWKISVYNLMKPEGLKAWLASETSWAKEYPIPVQTPIDLSSLALKIGNRSNAHLTAEFNIDGTLLIRSGFGDSDSGPDTVHIHSRHKNYKTPVPVIPGTSWAGVLRHRTLKIARTVSGDEKALDEQGRTRQKTVNGQLVPLLKADVFTDGMFGPSEIKKGNKDTKASRLSIKESEIEKSTSLVVTRVKIDRFTGGAYEGALFSEQPVIGHPDVKEKDGTRVRLDLCLHRPSDSELGLLLLLLKDLWIGDLPIGGESGVGRGRLQGVTATLIAKDHIWKFDKTDEEYGVTLTAIKGEDSPQKYVDEFNKIEKWMVRDE